MTTTQQQTFNPPFSNPDDMPEYVSIYDKPKRRTMTKEEKAQKKGTTIKDGTPRTANTYYLKRSSSEKHRETLINFFFFDRPVKMNFNLKR